MERKWGIEVRALLEVTTMDGERMAQRSVTFFSRKLPEAGD